MTYHTNIRHQETVALLGTRNLQLRVVYAHIANYTMAKGAWCGKRQKLAEELEMERSVISRKLDELITMGVVVADGDSYRAVNTEERAVNTEERAESTEKRAENTEKRAVSTEKRAESTEKRAESTSPTPPIYKENIKEMEKENNYARAQRRTAQAPTLDSFDELLKAFTLRVGDMKLADSLRDECLRTWRSDQYPDWKKKMLIEKVQNGERMKPRLDWLLADFDPKPENWNGRELDRNTRYVTAKYNGRWGLYTKEDVEIFGLEVKQ